MKSSLDIGKSDTANSVGPIVRDRKTNLQNMYLEMDVAF